MCTTEEAIRLIDRFGPPEYIDFDHDLADGDDAKVFLKWLSEYHFNSPPSGWSVHSQNPTAKDWIDSYINSWRKVLEQDEKV